MAASAAQIAQLRRLVAEPTTDTYDDTALAGYIEAWPLLDERGEMPYTWDASTTPPTQEANDAWIATYDLQAAAADVWEEKAAALADRFDYTADGAAVSLSQKYQQAMGRVRYHRSRRSPKSGTLVKWPKESDVDRLAWIGNLPEPE